MENKCSLKQQEGTSKKRIFKYFGKYGLTLNEETLRKQAIYKRDIISSNFKRYMNKTNGMKLKMLFIALKSAKRIQRLSLDTFIDYEITKREYAKVSKILSTKRSLRALCVRKVCNNNRIKDEHIEEFMRGLGELHHLKAVGIKLKSLGIGENGIEKMKKNLKKLGGIKSIDLEIDSKQVTNEWLEKLSKGLSGLSSLQKAEISFPKGEKITNKGLQKLGENIKRISALRSFGFLLLGIESLFENDQSEGLGLSLLKRGLQRLKSLEEVRLCFPIALFDDLDQVLSGLEALKKVILHFSDEEIYVSHLGCLRLMRDFPNVSLENLKVCWVSDESLRDLSQKLKEIKGLQSLDIRFEEMKITEEGIGVFGGMLCELPCLKNLKIMFSSNFSFGSGQVIALSQYFKELLSLSQLKLSFIDCGYIADEAVESLNQAWKGHENLGNISLNFDAGFHFSNKGLKILAEGLNGLKSLKKLSLYLNQFESTNDEEFEDLAQGLEGLKGLKEINLTVSNFWKISDKALKSLGESLKKLEMLQYVWVSILGRNLVTEKGVKELDESLKGIPREIKCLEF